MFDRATDIGFKAATLARVVAQLYDHHLSAIGRNEVGLIRMRTSHGDALGCGEGFGDECVERLMRANEHGWSMPASDAHPKMGDPLGRTDEAAQSGVTARLDGKRIDRRIFVGGENHVRTEIHDPADRSIVVAPDEDILGAARRLDHRLQKNILARAAFEKVDRFTTRRAPKRLERELN